MMRCVRLSVRPSVSLCPTNALDGYTIDRAPSNCHRSDDQTWVCAWSSEITQWNAIDTDGRE